MRKTRVVAFASALFLGGYALYSVGFGSYAPVAPPRIWGRGARNATRRTSSTAF